MSMCVIRVVCQEKRSSDSVSVNMLQHDHSNTKAGVFLPTMDHKQS